MRSLKVALIFGLVSGAVITGLFRVGAIGLVDQACLNWLGWSGKALALHWQYLCIWVLAFSLAWTTVDIPRISYKLLVALAAAVEWLTLSWVLNLYGIAFSPLPGLGAMLLSAGMGLVYSQTEVGSRKRVLRNLFGQRLSSRTFNTLVDLSTPLTFNGEVREASVLVCELLNGEQLSEALPVGDFVAMNNLFLRNGSEFLVAAGGYLDECEGERLRVIFGAPLAEKEHAAAACKAALELVRRLEAVNAESDVRWGKRLDFRIGVSSGQMILATYGSERLGTYSAAGEPVEFARRLSSANALYGSQILVSARTFELASEAVEVRPIELIRGRSDQACEEVYELLARKGELSEEEIALRDRFWKGVIHYRAKLWEEALKEFQAVLQAHETDGPAGFYVQRVQRMRSGDPGRQLESSGQMPTLQAAV